MRGVEEFGGGQNARADEAIFSLFSYAFSLLLLSRMVDVGGWTMVTMVMAMMMYSLSVFCVLCICRDE